MQTESKKKSNPDLGRLIEDLRKEKTSLESQLRHYSSMSDPTAAQFEAGYKQGMDNSIRFLTTVIRRYDYLV